MTFSLAQAAARIAYGVYGAKTYADALAAGDMAPDDVIEARRAICKACPKYTVTKVAGMTSMGAFCGEPFVNNEEAENIADRTCGCSMLKTHVASQSCPQGKWVAVTVKGRAVNQSESGPSRESSA